MKYFYNRRLRPRVYFWRDNHGNEIDCVIEQADKILAVEIKAGKTLNTDFFDGLQYWNEVSGDDSSNSFLVYGGKDKHRYKGINAFGWQDLASVYK